MLVRAVALTLLVAVASCSAKQTSSDVDAGGTGTACMGDGSWGALAGPCTPDASPSCFGCMGAAGFYCSCAASDGGPAWRCVGTEKACQ